MQSLGVGMEEAAMLRLFLILFALVLYPLPLLSQMAMPVLRGTDPPAPILVQEPYCELGNGPCGGACNEEGKKPRNCPAETLPCYQKGQRCTCEEADICKPKKKTSELNRPPGPAQRANQAVHQPSDRTDQWQRVLSRLGL
jgi:hypothetical protein